MSLRNARSTKSSASKSIVIEKGLYLRKEMKQRIQITGSTNDFAGLGTKYLAN